MTSSYNLVSSLTGSLSFCFVHSLVVCKMNFFSSNSLEIGWQNKLKEKKISEQSTVKHRLVCVVCQFYAHAVDD